MSVSFQPFTNPNNLDNCGICYEPLTTNAVAHTGVNGERHPLHRECIKNWILENPTCPFCQEPVDASSLFSWKDRVIVELNHIQTDAYHGAVQGLMLIFIVTVGLAGAARAAAAAVEVGAADAPRVAATLAAGVAATLAAGVPAGRVEELAAAARVPVAVPAAVAAVAGVSVLGEVFCPAAAAAVAAVATLKVTNGFIGRRGLPHF